MLYSCPVLRDVSNAMIKKYKTKQVYQNDLQHTLVF